MKKMFKGKNVQREKRIFNQRIQRQKLKLNLFLSVDLIIIEPNIPSWIRRDKEVSCFAVAGTTPLVTQHPLPTAGRLRHEDSLEMSSASSICASSLVRRSRPSHSYPSSKKRKEN